MKIRIIQVICIFLILLINLSAQAQAPIIKNVSVINEQGHVRISWEYSGSDDLIIRRDTLSLDLNTTLPICTIPNLSSIGSYIDKTAKAHEKPRSYRINEKTDFVSTIYLTSSYDSCAQEINLKWNDLETEYFTANEWTPDEFIIHVNEDGNVSTIPIDASNWTYTIPDILENTDYNFYIETKWQESPDDSISNSNPIHKYTDMPESPDYINALSASANGKDTELKFRVSPNNELNTYKVLKSDSYNGIYDTLGTIITNKYTIDTTDYNSKPGSEISYYKLISVNGCGNATTNSDIINNIVLEVENEEFINTLNWNLFKEEGFISINYDIYRISGNENPELIHSIQNYNTTYDDIESLQKEGLTGQYCYFIKAKELSTFNDDYSQSNTACIYLEPKIYIPEAFTPNDDGINEIFKPSFSFTPDYFEMKIYNRWGNVVYETRNFETGWNGKQNNGNPAPTGTYIYYIKIKTPANEIIEKRGNLTVFYP